MVQACGQNSTCNSLQHIHITGAAGIPVPHLGDNLHSVWGHRVRTGCGACILMDAWWVLFLHQDVSREGCRALAEANHSPKAAHHDPAPAEKMQRLSELSPANRYCICTDRNSIPPSGLFSCSPVFHSNPPCWLLGWVDEVGHGPAGMHQDGHLEEMEHYKRCTSMAAHPTPQPA